VTIRGAESVVVVVVKKRTGFVPGENAPQLVTRNLLIVPLTVWIVVVD